MIIPAQNPKSAISVIIAIGIFDESLFNLNFCF